ATPRSGRPPRRSRRPTRRRSTRRFHVRRSRSSPTSGRRGAVRATRWRRSWRKSRNARPDATSSSRSTPTPCRSATGSGSVPSRRWRCSSGDARPAGRRARGPRPTSKRLSNPRSVVDNQGMPDPVAVQSRPDVRARLGAFVLERYPFAAAAVGAAVAQSGGSSDAASIARLRADLPGALRRPLQAPPADLPECTPAVPPGSRWRVAVDELLDACDAFLHRAEIRASLTRDERLEIMRGMTLTRATDNRLKALFTGGDVRYKDTTFQGKGFRSLGQEAIYAAAIRLRRGDPYRPPDGWRGDVIAPIIRDLGAELEMSPARERSADMIRLVMSAEMGKAGPPMDGRDLHVGDFDRGILPAAAPLGTGALTLAGMAFAFRQQGDGRVAITFIGEGGT